MRTLNISEEMKGPPEDVVNNFWTSLDKNNIVAVDLIREGSIIKVWLTLDTPAGQAQSFLGQEALIGGEPAVVFPFPSLSHYMALLTICVQFERDQWGGNMKDYVKVTIGKGNVFDSQEGISKKNLLFEAKEHFDMYSSPQVFHFTRNKEK